MTLGDGGPEQLLVQGGQEQRRGLLFGEFKENLRVLLISGLFILLAARIRLDELLSISWRHVAFLAVLIVVGRPLTVAVSTWGSGLNWRERAFLSWIAPRGIVAAAVSSLFALRLGEYYPAAGQLVTLTFMVIIGTAAIYGLTAAPVARWLGVAQQNPQGALIVVADQAQYFSAAHGTPEVHLFCAQAAWGRETVAHGGATRGLTSFVRDSRVDVADGDSLQAEERTTMQSRNYRISVAAFALAGVLVAGPATALGVGDRAPEINATDWLNTKPLSLAALRGRLVAVEFWATWCPPCVRTIPHLIQLHNQYNPKGVTLISLTNEPRRVVEPFAQKMGMTYRIGLGSTSSGTYGVRGIPHAVLVSPDGKILWRGHPGGGALDRAIAQALKTHPPRLLSPQEAKQVAALLARVKRALARGALAEAQGPLGQAERIDRAHSVDEVAALRQEVRTLALERLARTKALEKQGQAVEALARYRALRGAFGAGSAEEGEVAGALQRLETDSNVMVAIALNLLEQSAAKLLAKAQAAERRKDFAQAVRTYEQIVKRYPSAFSGAKAAARLATLKADPALMSRIARQRDIKKVRRLMARARSWAANGRSELAIADYRKVAQLAPGSPEAAQATAQIKALSTPARD